MNNKQKTLQVGSLVKCVVNNRIVEGKVLSMSPDNEYAKVSVPAYYHNNPEPLYVVEVYNINDIKLVTNECPKRKGE